MRYSPDPSEVSQEIDKDVEEGRPPDVGSSTFEAAADAVVGGIGPTPDAEIPAGEYYQMPAADRADA